ncbi:MAG: hypothetical protein WC668_02685 [Patescibacteria group bacterium]|jgi:hypothetical protein
MRKIMATVAILVLIIITSGCGNDPADPANVKSVPTANMEMPADSLAVPNFPDIIDYGNGVYYFSHNRANFGNTLSMFIKTHPELELVSVAADNSGIYGATIGYFVVLKSKT